LFRRKKGTAGAAVADHVADVGTGLRPNETAHRDEWGAVSSFGNGNRGIDDLQRGQNGYYNDRAPIEPLVSRRLKVRLRKSLSMLFLDKSTERKALQSMSTEVVVTGIWLILDLARSPQVIALDHKFRRVAQNS
jgi:hypothetical protein